MSFIPGMAGVVASGGSKSAFGALAVIGSNYSEETATVAYPVGVVLKKGDVAIHFDFCHGELNGSNPTSVIPSGFTSLSDLTGFGIEVDAPDISRTRFIISYKILTGFESGTLLGMQSNRYEGKFILILRGSTEATNVTIGGYAYNSPGAGTPNPATIVIPAGSGIKPLLVFGYATKDSPQAVFTNGTPSPAFGTLNAAPDRQILGYTVYNKGDIAVSHTVDSDAAGSSRHAALAGGYIAFS